MTDKEIQRALMLRQWQRAIVFPNYTPPKWWECDVFELTKSGYFREYEIKLTTSDFRADAKKVMNRWTGNTSDYLEREIRNKHKMLGQRDTRGPSSFWFVAPVGIVPANELPEWAGLLLVIPSRFRPDGITFQESKKAPRLHKQKIDDKVRQDLLTTCYFRFQRMFLFKDKTPPETVETGI